jgi:hypothetical protein
VSGGGWRARRAVAAWLAAAVLHGGAGASAASFTLTPGETRAALRFGADSVQVEAFDAEWRVDNGRGETVVVLTPFHRLAIAARHAAFKNEEVRPAELDRLLRDQRDRLVLWAYLTGRREDFARGLRPELRLGDRTIKAAFVQNERTPAPASGGGYLARCLYTFPTKELSGASRVVLVVRDADGREAHTFAIDLGAMR